MPVCRINQADIWYEDSGPGEETVMFAHGLLMDHRMFDRQVADLAGRYRCVRYDHRGQGRSEITAHGYDMDSLADDAAELIRRLDCGPCHFVGLSMGGFVGLRLALYRPELLRSLTLLASTADPESPGSRRRYRLLAMAARLVGFRPLMGQITPLLFGDSFLRDPARNAEHTYWRQHLSKLDRTGTLRAARAVIERQGVADDLHRIALPTLIVVGEEDRATPVAKAERMHHGIPGSQWVRIERAGHTPTIERPAQVSDALQAFLGQTSQK